MEYFFRYKLDHLLFWTLTIGFHAYTRLDLLSEAGPGVFAGELLVRNSLLAAAIYPTVLVLLPALTRGSKLFLSLGGLAVVMAGYVGLKNIHDMYVYGEMPGQAQYMNFFYPSFYNLSIVTFYLAFAVTLHLSKQWYLQQNLLRQMKMEKLSTELAYLKSQINPHFLFNSLNTIFFQIDKQNTQARESLKKFSDMLRYQLYECNGHEIAIERELHYLKSYVDLQHLRTGKELQLDFTCEPTVAHFSLPPLLLIPFIENAFKHVSHHTGKPNIISIQLKKQAEVFRLHVMNTRDGARTNTASPGGIGLKNVQRRLQLLFPEKHRLQIQATDDRHSITLELTLPQ
jgi:LytS/YehU family sensor histidine kinase